MHKRLVICSQDEVAMPEIVTPVPNKVKEGSELSFSCRVIALAFGQLLRAVTDDSLLSPLNLGEDAANGIILEAPVGVENKRL
jgi:hypothetical protein